MVGFLCVWLAVSRNQVTSVLPISLEMSFLGLVLNAQVWAVVWREAAGYYHRGTTFSTPAHLEALDGIFNYTVTYRRDADIPFTYFEKNSQSELYPHNSESHQCRWKEVEVCIRSLSYSWKSASLGIRLVQLWEKNRYLQSLTSFSGSPPTAPPTPTEKSEF